MLYRNSSILLCLGHCHTRSLGGTDQVHSSPLVTVRRLIAHEDNLQQFARLYPNPKTNWRTMTNVLVHKR